MVWKADYKPFGDADVNVNIFENSLGFRDSTLILKPDSISMTTDIMIRGRGDI